MFLQRPKNQRFTGRESVKSISIKSYSFSAASGLALDVTLLFVLTSIGISVPAAQLLSGACGALTLYFLESSSIKNKYSYVWVWAGYQSIWIYCQSSILSIIHQATGQLLTAKTIVAGVSFLISFLVLKCISFISRPKNR